MALMTVEHVWVRGRVLLNAIQDTPAKLIVYSDEFRLSVETVDYAYWLTKTCDDRQFTVWVMPHVYGENMDPRSFLLWANGLSREAWLVVGTMTVGAMAWAISYRRGNELNQTNDVMHLFVEQNDFPGGDYESLRVTYSIGNSTWVAIGVRWSMANRFPPMESLAIWYCMSLCGH